MIFISQENKFKSTNNLGRIGWSILSEHRRYENVTVNNNMRSFHKSFERNEIRVAVNRMPAKLKTQEELKFSSHKKCFKRPIMVNH